MIRDAIRRHRNGILIAAIAFTAGAYAAVSLVGIIR